MANELFYLYEIVKLDYLEDRLQYSLEDWSLSLPDADPELMMKLVSVAAEHPRANMLRVLRVIRAWTRDDLNYIFALAAIK